MEILGKNKPFLKASSIGVGLATFLVAGLSGCDVKDDRCNDMDFVKSFPNDCKNNNIIPTDSKQEHTSISSWVPLWLMLNNSNNAHSGYSYSSNGNSKGSGYFSSSGSSSSGG